MGTGETVLRREDLRLPGYIPLTLARTYRSGREGDGPFGHRWRLNWAITLRAESDQVVYAPETSHETTFDAIDVQMQARHANGTLIQHYPDSYVIAPAPSRRLVFEKENARGDTIPLSRVEDPGGNSIHFFYDRGRIAGIVDTIGRQIRFDYQGGSVSRVRVDGEQGASTVRAFQYNGSGDLVKETDAEGYAASFGYQRHLMVHFTRRQGGTQYAQYDENERCIALWFADGSEARQFAFDDHRQSARVVGGEGRQTLYRHTQPGRVIERIDPLDRSQDYYYDEVQQLIGFSDGDDQIGTFQRVSVEDGEGFFVDREERVALLEMDDNLHVTAVLDGRANHETIAYNAKTGPVEFRTAAGLAWTFSRSGRRAVTRIESPSGQALQCTRHSDGQVLELKDEIGLRVKDHVDERGRLVERTDGLRRRFQWRYDANGRLQSVLVGGQSVEFDYSAGGHITQIVDAAGQKVRLAYDPFGRLRQCATPDRQSEVTYDASGCVHAVADSQTGTTQFRYDERGTLERIEYGNGREARYRRRDGGVEMVTDGPEGTTTVHYNAEGYPIEWEKPDAPARQFEYGPSGELVAVEEPGRSVDLTYDEEGHVVRAADGGEALHLDYDSGASIEGIRADGPVRITCERDARGRLTGIQVGDQSIRLAYDAGDRLRGVQCGQQQWSFGYDGFDHLVKRGGPRQRQPESRAAESGDVDEYTVLRKEGGDARHEIAVQVHAARHGVAVSAQVGPWRVPLWGRGDCLAPGDIATPALVAASLARGADSIREQLQPPFAPRLPARWMQRIARGVRWDYTAIPTRADLGHSNWTPLDRFFLRRTFYEMGYPSLLPRSGGVPDWPSRSPDAWVTGTHQEGVLRPPIWETRMAGPHLYHRALGCPPNATTALDIVEFIWGGAPWT